MLQGKYIWMDGKFVAWDKAQIHVLSHGLHYGGTVYEGIRVYPVKVGNKIVPHVFRLDDHLKRFVNSMKEIAMRPPYSTVELKKITIELLKKNKISDGYIRPIAFYGYERLGIYWGGLPVSVAVAAMPWPPYLPKEGMKLMTSHFKRLSNTAVKIEAKVGAYYVNSNYATEEAKQNGFDEAILLDEKGIVTEAACANIFFVKYGKKGAADAQVITPKRGEILPGFTRDSVIALAKDLGFKVVEKDIPGKSVYGFDESFTTGTATEVNAVVKIDDKKIGNGKMGEVTAALKAAYTELVHGGNEKYNVWLSAV